MREPLPKARGPEKMTATAFAASPLTQLPLEDTHTVADTLVKEIPLTLKVPLVTLAVQLFAAR